MTAASVPAELLIAVVEYFQPLQVILFGSAARGDAGPDSDIELLVIPDDDTPPGAPDPGRRIPVASFLSSCRGCNSLPGVGLRAQEPDRWGLGLHGGKRGRDRL
jgi:hypothetical protein